MPALPTIVLALATVAAAMPPPPAPGTVAVVLADDADDVDDAGDDQSFADAVGQALGAADFTLLPGHSRYVAEVRIVRAHRGIVTAKVSRDAPSIGGGNGGLAVALPFGSSKKAFRDLVATTLTVRLLTRRGMTPVWSGSAMTAAIDGAPIATKLARAALATYPQTIDRTISVP